MRAEWAYYKGHFTPEQCDQIINEGLISPEEKGTLGPVGFRVNNEWRKNSIRGIIRSPKWAWLYLEIDKLVAQANKSWFNVEYNYLPEMQLASYRSEEQEFYKRHQDAFLVSPTGSNRKLSFSIQLSDPSTYEGSDLKFLDIGKMPNSENIRAQGSVIIFPSIVFHEVTPITQGIRYSMVGWYEGPPWR
jgi:PKHD-type hydroxylase